MCILKIDKSFCLGILVQYQFQYHSLPVVEPKHKTFKPSGVYSALTFPQWQQSRTDFL